MPAPISPDSPFQDALRLRPLFATKVAFFGPDCWERPQAPLHAFFPGAVEALQELLREAVAWAVPDARSDWRELSAAHLLDHLTQNHREFFDVLLADVQRLFDARRDDATGAGSEEEIAALREDLDRFAAALRARVERDERELFPRVLRYEAALRDPRVDPEFNGGSLSKAVAYRTVASAGDPAGGEPARKLEALLERLAASGAARAGDPWLSLLENRLAEFRDRLAEHERLKTDVLYPMALEAEKMLYNLSIGGAGRPAAAVA